MQQEAAQLISSSIMLALLIGALGLAIGTSIALFRDLIWSLRMQYKLEKESELLESSEHDWQRDPFDPPANEDEVTREDIFNEMVRNEKVSQEERDHR